jgi:peptidoglycan/xylan/chitin deacetylase (PgdA/CDA1 family)
MIHLQAQADFSEIPPALGRRGADVHASLRPLLHTRPPADAGASAPVASTGGLLRRTVKAALIRGLFLVSTIHRSRGVPVFCYHSVDDSGSLLSVSPALFERQMAYLKNRGYQTISLSRLCQALRIDQPLPQNAIVLTFDDGFRSMYTTVLPILRRHAFTATFFVPTGYVGKQMTWAKTPDVPDLELAAWDELRQMADAGMDIQAHSVSHPDLRKLSPQQARDEIEGSKTEIEARLRKRVTLFAYPYGLFSNETVHILRALNFLGAVTATVGRTMPGDSLYRLKRVNPTEIADVSDTTRMLFFKCCTTGASSYYHNLKAWLPALVRRYSPWDDDPES